MRRQRRHEAQGNASLVHQLRGQVSNRKLGPTLASEMFAEHHQIVMRDSRVLRVPPKQQQPLLI
ncbi:MAG: hypothetical protein EPN46_06425 [Candidimonas sp.]|nr:MAG: hypothetical protein EPN77_13380 [Candidimonas sp.]TAM23569.1 MAG: hypothetical protein EPN62_09035 [Candidimonas sp.]TAM77288.1 MAG: hypothetical protein EPN46_06425 [Candidimonas sp.]